MDSVKFNDEEFIMVDVLCKRCGATVTKIFHQNESVEDVKQCYQCLDKENSSIILGPNGERSYKGGSNE